VKLTKIGDDSIKCRTFLFYFYMNLMISVVYFPIMNLNMKFLQIAVDGRPNVGKSSLLNAWSKVCPNYFAHLLL